MLSKGLFFLKITGATQAAESLEGKDLTTNGRLMIRKMGMKNSEEGYITKWMVRFQQWVVLFFPSSLPLKNSLIAVAVVIAVYSVCLYGLN